MTTRREFVKNAALLGGLAAVAAPNVARAGLAASAAPLAVGGQAPAVGEHQLPKLPYAYDALEPFLDAQTMEIHHGKHHQGYVNLLNSTEKALVEARAKGDFASIKILERDLAFAGSGHINHSVFWSNMKPKGVAKAAPTGALAKQIAKDFGSQQALLGQFAQAAKTVEGNGWGVLVYHPGFKRLYVLSVLNHQSSWLAGAQPLLLVDVWEHAYYLKYQNKRADYIQNWWNVVDWADVETRFAAVAK